MRTTAWLLGLSLLVSLFTPAAQAQTRRVTDASPPAVAAFPIVRVTVENPREINIGKPASFTVSVSNAGKAMAHDVVVDTNVPTHAELSGTTPKPSEIQGSTVRFRIGDLAPGATRKLTLVAIPRTIAPIKLGATTTFSSATQSTLIVRQPMLKLLAQVAPRVEIGTEVDMVLRVVNTGDGRADDVVVTPQLVEGEVQGTPLRQPVKIGSLKPGESKEVQFSVIPTRRGKLATSFKGTNADGLEASAESTIQVLQAGLAVSAVGPVVQPIAREGNYEIQVTNPGDASTGSTLVVVKIPAGMEVTAAAEHSYDKSTRSLRWRITKLRPSDVVKLPFKAETTVAGDQTLKVVAQCERIDDATATHTTSVISRSNLIVTVVNDQELAAIEDQVSFKVSVVNAGSKPVDDLRVNVAMPSGLLAVPSADYQVEEGRISFPVHKLASGEKVTLGFRAVGKRVGEHFVQVQVGGGALSRQLTFDSSTYCYSNDEVPVSAKQPGSLPNSIK